MAFVIKNNSPRHLLFTICCYALVASHIVQGQEGNNDAVDMAKGGGALTLHATAFRKDILNQIGGITYDESTNTWHGIFEGTLTADPLLHAFQANWEPYINFESPLGTVDVISSHAIYPGGGLKLEGIEAVPSSSCTKPSSLFSPTVDNDIDTTQQQFWVVSESHSHIKETSSYFSKRFGQPDLNTFVPNSLKDSRLLRVSSSGKMLEEIELPQWLNWDGVFDWDPTKCYGTRVYKGLHDLTLLEPSQDDTINNTQLISMNQIALYQDGPEPTIFEGSHIRIMFWDVVESKDDYGCITSPTYSRSYRYEASRLQIDTFQKGARHLRAVFGMLALSSTEFLITETELLEGFGILQFVSDVYYVKIESENDTVDHCDSLMDCEDVTIPIKRHVLRRHHPMELADVAWGPNVENKKTGEMVRTVVVSFENDEAGILMELYTLNMTHLELEPIWENNQDSTVFIQQRSSVLIVACVLFGLGFVIQIWWIRRQLAKEQHGQLNDSQRSNCGESVISASARNKLEYKDYILVSAVVNSCLLGGVVFGFPGLVLILRREGIYAEVCSCGVFCAGQQEQISILSTTGFAAAIGSRLFAGIFLDKLGPKLTGVCSGIVSTAGLILLATAKDVVALTDRVTAAWIILAVGGSSMHLTSFHVTNLQDNPADKRKSSLYISAGFGAGSLVLPVLQVINQFGDVKLQTLCGIYSCIAVLLTVNSFFVQPWRAWNSIGSEAAVDLNCFRRSWWPSSILELTAVKKNSDAKFPPLNDVFRSFTFWGECGWFSCQLFLLTYYLSTISQILFALGDATVNQNVDSLQNNMFTRACVFFNGFGWLWSPIVGYLMKTKSIYFRIYLEIVMAFVMSLMLTVPIIEVQVVVFMLQALVRLQVFSNHFAYIGERFGFRHFGLLNGISSLVAGSFGLLGYLLQVYSLFIAKGNFSLSYFFVAALVLSSSIFPFVLRKKDQHNAAFEEEKRENRDLETAQTGNEGNDLVAGVNGTDDEEYYGAMVEDPSYEAFLAFLYSPSEQAPKDETKAEEATSTARGCGEMG